jgi:hypothetical protein
MDFLVTNDRPQYKVLNKPILETEMWEAPKSQENRFHRKKKVILTAWLF